VKVAILLDAAEKYPEIKAALDAIKDENLKRQKEGKPLGAGERDKTYLATNGKSIPKYVAVIKELLPELTKALATLKAALKKPRIEHRDKKEAYRACGA
jgi:hypothetical protein